MTARPKHRRAPMSLVAEDSSELSEAAECQQFSEEELAKISEFRSQNALLRNGVIVEISDVTSVDETSSVFVIKATLMADVGGMPQYGEVKFKVGKQAAGKLKRELDRYEC